MIILLVNLSYQDLLTISAALHTFETVYATGNTCELQERLDACIEAMDNNPVTDFYFREGVGTVIT